MGSRLCIQLCFQESCCLQHSRAEGSAKGIKTFPSKWKDRGDLRVASSPKKVSATAKIAPFCGSAKHGHYTTWSWNSSIKRSVFKISYVIHDSVLARAGPPAWEKHSWSFDLDGQDMCAWRTRPQGRFSSVSFFWNALAVDPSGLQGSTEGDAPCCQQRPKSGSRRRKEDRADETPSRHKPISSKPTDEQVSKQNEHEERKKPDTSTTADHVVFVNKYPESE